MASRLARFGLDATLFGGARLAAMVSTLIGAFIFTRLLSPDAYGAFAFILAAALPLVSIATEWAGQPLGRFYSELHSRGAADEYAALLARSLRWVATVTLLIAIPFGVYIGHSNGAALGLASALFLASTAALNLLNPILPAALDMRYYAAVQVIQPLVQLGVALALTWAVGASPLVLLWAATAAAAVTALLLAARVRRRLAPARGPPREWRRFVRYGLPMLAFFFASQVLAIGDRIVIGLYSGAGAVGIYSANYNLAVGVAAVVGIPLVFAAFPHITSAWSSGEPAHARRLIGDITLVVIGVGALITAGVAVTGNAVLVPLLGPSFRIGLATILPVVIGQSAWYLTLVGHKVLELTERTTTMLYCLSLAACLNVGLNVLLIPRMGYVVAAYTTLVGYGAYAIAVKLAAPRALPWDIRWGPALLLVTGAGLGAVLALEIVPAATLVAALVRGVIVVVVFSLAAWSSLVWEKRRSRLA